MTPIEYARLTADRERVASLRYTDASTKLAAAMVDLYVHIAECVRADLDRYEAGVPFLGDSGIEFARRQHRTDEAEREQRLASEDLHAATKLRIAAFAALPWPATARSSP